MKNVLMAILAMGFLSACSVVGPGQRGIRVSLGTVSDEVKTPGAYGWLPFLVGMKKIDVQLQKSDVKSSAASKDMQEITTEVAVNWSINPDTVIQLYKSIGDENDVYDRVIQPAVSEVLKAAASKRTAEEILTQRMDLKRDIDEGLTARLAKHGVILSDVSIVNLSFSHDFTAAIERKQVAEQEAKQASYNAQRATEDAKAAVNKAKGEAEANALKLKTLTPMLIQYEATQKWNGQLPTMMSGNTVPFLNITPSK